MVNLSNSVIKIYNFDFYVVVSFCLCVLLKINLVPRAFSSFLSKTLIHNSVIAKRCAIDEVAWSYSHEPNIWEKLKISSKMAYWKKTAGKVQCQVFFVIFLLILTKFSFWLNDSLLGYHSVQLWNFR